MMTRMRQLASGSGESGQATAEYVSTTAILAFGLLAGTSLAGLPVGKDGQSVSKLLFDGLQLYVDMFEYCLNIAIG